MCWVLLFISWILPLIFHLGLWIFITLLPTLISNKENNLKKLVFLDYFGLFVWIFGFAFEVIADYQKLAFKNDPDNTVCT